MPLRLLIALDIAMHNEYYSTLTHQRSNGENYRRNGRRCCEKELNRRAKSVLLQPLFNDVHVFFLVSLPGVNHSLNPFHFVRIAYFTAWQTRCGREIMYTGCVFGCVRWGFISFSLFAITNRKEYNCIFLYTSWMTCGIWYVLQTLFSSGAYMRTNTRMYVLLPARIIFLHHVHSLFAASRRRMKNQLENSV